MRIIDVPGALQYGVKFSGENLADIAGLCAEDSFKKADSIPRNLEYVSRALEPYEENCGCASRNRRSNAKLACLTN